VCYARNCCATGSLNVLNPSPAFVSGKPTSQSGGKFTEIPRFGYMFVNLGTAKIRNCRDNCVIPELTRPSKNTVAPAKAGAHHVCPDRPTGEIGPSLRWGDGCCINSRDNSGDRCPILGIAVREALPHHLPALPPKRRRAFVDKRNDPIVNCSIAVKKRPQSWSE